LAPVYESLKQSANCRIRAQGSERRHGADLKHLDAPRLVGLVYNVVSVCLREEGIPG